MQVLMLAGHTVYIYIVVQFTSIESKYEGSEQQHD